MIYNEQQRRRAEVDVWDGLRRQKIRDYISEGDSQEKAEDRADAYVRREIRSS